MKLRSMLWVTGMAAMLAGCAVAPRTSYDYTAFRQSDPRSILVLMPVNSSPDVKAASSVLAQATVPLAEMGYYVFPVAVVDEMFRQNGLSDGQEIQTVPTRKLREVFGADAAMYLEVEDYGASYQVLQSVSTVTVNGRLVDLRTGGTLWEGRASGSSSSGGDGGSPLGMLLTAVADQIANTVTDSSYDLAAEVDDLLFNVGSTGGLLYGPYHPAYGKSEAAGP